MSIDNEYSKQNINKLDFIPEAEGWFNSHKLINTSQHIKIKRKK